VSNTNVPQAPLLLSLEGDDVRIEWAAPARNGYSWNIYAGVEGTGSPIPGPALNAAPWGTQNFTFKLAAVAGNSPPTNNLEVAVTSVLLVNGQESAQSPLTAINVDAGDPAKPNHPTVGRAPNGDPTYLSTDENGVLNAAASLAPPAGGFATETTLSTIDGKTPALGQAPMAASVPVAIASDQSPVPATVAGVSTAANQATEIASLATIAGDTTSLDAKTPAQGQALMAASVPVAMASNQPAIPAEEKPFSSAPQTLVPAVGSTSTPLPATPLVGRRLVAIQNKGTTSLMVNDGTADGNSWEVPGKGSVKIGVGPGILLEGFRTAGTADVLVWEFA